MNRIGLLGTLSLLAVLLLPSFSEAQIKLGVSAPLTGPAAAWGNDLRNVLTFANEKLAAEEFSFVVEDDQCDPKTAVSVAQKLTALDKVQAVFTVCGAVTLAVGPLYQNSHTVVMAPLATPSRISGLGNSIFRTGLSDAFAASRLADYIGRHQKSVGILTEQNEYSVGFLNDFSKRAAEINLAVIHEEFQSTDQDFKSQLLRLKTKAPQALFVNTNVERPFATILRQMKELQFVAPVYGAYLPGSSAFINLAGSLAEGIVFIDFPPADELLNEEGKKLYQEYLNRYGPLQSWTFAFPATFEAFRAIQQAIDSGKSMQDYLHSETFQGIFGEYAFDKNGDIVGLHHSMRKIQSGRNVLMPEGAG